MEGAIAPVVMKIHEELIAPTLGLAVRSDAVQKKHPKTIVQTHLFGLRKVSANCQLSDAN